MSGRDIMAHASAALGGVADADKLHLYRCMDQAAMDFVRLTYGLRDSVVITTVADQQRYDLPKAFIEPYVRDENRRLYGKYEDADGDLTYPVVTSYEKLFMTDMSETRTRPRRFAIRQKPDAAARTTGTATADGAAADGECRLTAAAADFSDMAERDRVLNTTDGSAGIVLEVVSSTVLDTALFSGTANEWTTGDRFVLVPVPRFEIVLDAPSEVDGDTLTLPYLKKPAPVFSDARSWQIEEASWRAIAMEGVYQYLIDYDYDRKDDRFHGMFLEEVRKVKTRRARQRLQGGGYRERA